MQKILTEADRDALVFGADLAEAQGRSWFLLRGNRVKFTKDDALPMPEPFNIMSLYNFTTKYGDNVHVLWSINPNPVARDILLVKAE